MVDPSHAKPMLLAAGVPADVLAAVEGGAMPDKHVLLDLLRKYGPVILSMLLSLLPK